MSLPSTTRSLAVILAALCVATTLGACGNDEESRVRIALLPYARASGGVWEWTAACRVGPRSPTGCAASGPDVGPVQLAGNAWNLGGGADATGSVRMSVSSSGGLEVKGDLSSAPPCTHSTCLAPEANTWVRGFPSVLYGIDQCNAATSPPQSPLLKLPMRVGSIPSSLIGTTTYTADASEITYTVAYDMWLNPSDTKTPCRTNGTLEVMVWTDHDAESRLPDSMRTANASIPYAVDGVAKSGDNAWAVYVSNVFPKGETAPWGGTVWFVLDAAHSVKSGTISVDLSVALAAVGGLVRDLYGWSDFASNYWLDTIAFGVEFGPDNGDTYGAGRTDFALNLTSYCLEVGTTASEAGC
jgi:hypothetical protein